MDDYEFILECIDAKLARIAEALEIIAGMKKETEEPKEQFSIDDVSLDYVNVCRKTRNALYRNGIKTVGEVRRFSEKQLLRIRNVGNEAIKDIVSMLAEYGFELPKYAKGEKK